MSKVIKLPLSFAYETIVRLRNRLFDTGLKKTYRVDFPVISIGNLTVGGTGKTPCILFLAEHFLRKGKSVAVVSRGYGRRGKGNSEVSVKENAPALFGDEPVLIKSRFDELRVFVGPHRGILLQEIAEKQKFDLALADDAFQHRQMHRDLNILIVDAMAPLEDYKLLPLGKLREPLDQVQRADIVLINKVNLVDDQKRKQVRDLIQSYCLPNTLVFHSSIKVSRIVDLFKEASQPVTCVLVSAVGRPESVERSVCDLVKVLDHKVYPDHHSYKETDAEEILKAFRASRAEVLLTTAKDAVKLQKFTHLRPYLRIAELSLSIDNEKNFYERVDQIFS